MVHVCLDVISLSQYKWTFHVTGSKHQEIEDVCYIGFQNVQASIEQ